MNKLLIILSCLVCWTAAGRLGFERKLDWWHSEHDSAGDSSHGSYGSYASIPSVDDAQKFFFDILWQVHKPLLHDYYVAFGQKTHYDVSDYFEPHGEILTKFLEHYKAHDILGFTDTFDAWNVEHIEQLVGVYHFFVFAKDWETFVHNVCYARIHFNPLLFVSALHLAVRDRYDTQEVVLPAWYESMPHVYYPDSVIHAVQAIDWGHLITKDSTIRPSASDVFGFGAHYRSPWQKWSSHGTFWPYHYEKPTEESYVTSEDDKYVVPWPVNTHGPFVYAKFADDISLNQFWSFFMTERMVHKFTAKYHYSSGYDYKHGDFKFGHKWTKGAPSWYHGSDADDDSYKYGHHDYEDSYKHTDEGYGKEWPYYKDFTHHYGSEKSWYPSHYESGDFEGHLPTADVGNDRLVHVNRRWHQDGSSYSHHTSAPKTWYDFSGYHGGHDWHDGSSSSHSFDSGSGEWHKKTAPVSNARLLHVGRRWRHGDNKDWHYGGDSKFGHYDDDYYKYGGSDYGHYSDDEHKYGGSEYGHYDDDHYKYGKSEFGHYDDDHYKFGGGDYGHYSDDDYKFGGSKYGYHDTDDYKYSKFGHYDTDDYKYSKFGHYDTDDYKYKYGPYGGDDYKYGDDYSGHWWNNAHSDHDSSHSSDDEFRYPRDTASPSWHKFEYGKEHHYEPHYEHHYEPHHESHYEPHHESHYEPYYEHHDDSSKFYGSSYPHEEYGFGSHSDHHYLEDPEYIRYRRSTPEASYSPSHEKWWWWWNSPFSGELFLHNMQQIVARMSIDKIAWQWGASSTPQQSWWWEDPKNVVSTKTKEYIHKAISELKTVIDSTIEKRHINWSSEQVWYLIADFFIGRDPEHGNLWEEIHHSVHYFAHDTHSGFEHAASFANLHDAVEQYLLVEMVNLFEHYKHTMPAHTPSDWEFKSVRVHDFTVDPLVTYTEPFDVEFINVFDQQLFGASHNYIEDVVRHPVVRQYRLNHKPFSFHFDVESEKNQHVVVRILMAPRIDEHGNSASWHDLQEHYIVMDTFHYHLEAGHNTIDHHSREFAWTKRDVTTIGELYHHVLTGDSSSSYWEKEAVGFHCHYPHHLLLPQGTKSGFPVQFLVLITPVFESHATDHWTHDEFKYMCGVGMSSYKWDNFPMSFPFDRDIPSVQHFHVPNAYFYDTVIHHEHYDHFEHA